MHIAQIAPLTEAIPPKLYGSLISARLRLMPFGAAGGWCSPPAALSKDLLGRMIAYRLQEQAWRA
jgi:hypothetical protein